MPISKNASFRYQVLDRCFSDFSRKYDIEDLLEAVNTRIVDLMGDGSSIQIRQLRTDISAIKAMLPEGVYLDAVPFDGKRCYYRYSDPDFSIYNNELSAEEVNKLKSTIDMLGKFRGLPSNGWLEDVISNLEVRFGVKSNSESLISFGQNDQLQGLEYLSQLIDATMAHTPLFIEYRSFKGELFQYVLHPYYMRPYNGRWFLYGLNQSRNSITNVALDRIESVREASLPFIPNTTTDFTTYFNDVVGATVPKPETDLRVEDVVLRFSLGRLPYVLSKPIHPSQMQVNETDIRLHVYITRELTQQIFSYGEDVEVLEPKWYRVEVAEKYQKIIKKYLSVQKDCTDAF